MPVDDEWASLAAGDKLATRLGKDPCAVSDVIVDTYMKCLVSFDTTRGSFRAYYLTCLRRELIRSKRDNKDTRDGQSSFGHSVLEELINKERDVDVEGLLARVLDEDELEMVRDRYYNGMSLWEIGVKHGVLKQAIWARFERILKKLRNEVR